MQELIRRDWNEAGVDLWGQVKLILDEFGRYSVRYEQKCISGNFFSKDIAIGGVIDRVNTIRGDLFPVCRSCGGREFSVQFVAFGQIQKKSSLEKESVKSSPKQSGFRRPKWKVVCSSDKVALEMTVVDGIPTNVEQFPNLC